MTLAHTLEQEPRIDVHAGLDRVTTYYPLNATNPYERLGKHVRDEIYRRCNYHIWLDKRFGHTEKDIVCVSRTTTTRLRLWVHAQLLKAQLARNMGAMA